jgi:3-methyladenine DNA glycosylase AlkD
MPLKNKWVMDLQSLINQLQQTEHGFTHIIKAGDTLLADASIQHFDTALALTDGESYQQRMLGPYLLGELSAKNNKALEVLKDKVSTDTNWRVQEMLAKAFDAYCAATGYEKALPVIKEWLANDNPNVKRAVTEGLRIWTSRPYFKEHPETAIQLISEWKGHDSEYLRKSVGNSLRDIRKKHRALIDAETATWNLSDTKTAFTYKLVTK